MDYFISDTHFNHNRILVFERGTKFRNIKDHNLYILKQFAKKLTDKKDRLFHLGDFGELKTIEELEIWSKLPCQKILIKGNHDSNRTDRYFDIVYNTPFYYSKRILLSHYPMPTTEGTLNVHGHLHGAILKSKNHLCVSIHTVDYQLFSHKKLIRALGKLTKDNWQFRQEWYKDIYEFIDGRKSPDSSPDYSSLLIEEENNSE